MWNFLGMMLLAAMFFAVLQLSKGRKGEAEKDV
jgi:hypothetical protein